jgi:hypothetical protein
MHVTGCEMEEGGTHGRLTRDLFPYMAIITDWYGIAQRIRTYHSIGSVAISLHHMQGVNRLARVVKSKEERRGLRYLTYRLGHFL